MKKYGNIILKSLFLGQLLMLCSCNLLHDDLSECDLFLKFRYDYNLENKDWFGEQVSEVKVFMFDKEGKYVETLSQNGPALAASDYKMKIPFHMKGYTAVVWAGKTDPDYILSQMAVGDPIDKLTLRYEPVENASFHQINPLWHNGPEQLTFPDASGSEQTLSLVRNTNDIYIKVSTNDPTLDPNTDITPILHGANGGYDYKNSFLPSLPEITYLPVNSDPEHIDTRYTLRLVKGSLMKLSLLDTRTGQLFYIGESQQTELNLIDELLKTKPLQMDDQEYLDRCYRWEIELNVDASSYMALSLTINGWTQWFHPIDL